MSAGITPGAWSWDGPVWKYDSDQDAPWLCNSSGVSILTGSVICSSEANARLIAAAPELLEALTMVRDADNDCRRDGLPVMPWAARNKIDAAIAKATGEKNGI